MKDFCWFLLFVLILIGFVVMTYHEYTAREYTMSDSLIYESTL